MKKRPFSPAREAVDEKPRSTSTKGLRIFHIFAYFIIPPLLAVLSGWFSFSSGILFLLVAAVMLVDVLLRWRFKKRQPDAELPVTAIEELFSATPQAMAVGCIAELVILREIVRLLVHG